MLKVLSFALLTFLAVWSRALGDFNRTETSTETINLSPSAKRDRFRIVHPDVADTELQEQIDDFISYGCESMVVITNDAQDPFRLWCATHHDKTTEVSVSKGESFIFTFRPQKDRKSLYWCTVQYNFFWARFDVFNENLPYMCPRTHDNVYRYSVRHDGIYANGENKIQALSKGHNKFQLWENFDPSTNQTDGLLTIGYIDGGMCSVLADTLNDRASAMTICDHQCIIAYEHYHCEGYSMKFQATGDCIDFQFTTMDKMVSSLKGC